MTRRRFLQLVGLGGAAAAVPLARVREAYGAEPLTVDDGICVIVTLGGGNDGLNTVVPFANPDYARLRPRLAIPAQQVLPIGEGLGLHPSLVATKARYDRGQVAVVQGVGYPNPSLSHFDSMAVWMAGTTGVSSSSGSTGWVGRYLDQLASPNQLSAVAVGSSLPPTLAGTARRGVAVPASKDALLGADLSDPIEQRFVEAAMALSGSGRGAWGAAVARNTTTAVDVARHLGPPLSNLPSNLGWWEQQAAVAANLLNAELGIRVLHLTFGGWDTHSGQVPTWHGELLRDLDRSIERLLASLSPAVAEQVVVMVVSEFGRRPQSNDSAGTDHGTASNVLLYGTRVAGGLYGAQPSLTALDRDDNLVHEVDFRSVYGTVLDRWLGGSSNSVLGRRFEDLVLFGTPVAPPASDPGDSPPPGSGAGGGGGGEPGPVVLVPVPPMPDATTPAPEMPTPEPMPPATPPAPGAPPLVIVDDSGVPHGHGVAVEPPPPGTRVVGAATSAGGSGYWLMGADGAIYAYGTAPYLGGANTAARKVDAVDLTSTPSGRGYWITTANGGVHCFGDAPFHGSAGAMRLRSRVVGMAATPSGGGYWLAGADGRVLAFGPEARLHGSPRRPGFKLAAPVVGIAATPSGQGYWMVGADGGVFCFGDAAFHGAAAGTLLMPVVTGIVPSPDGNGYLLTLANGQTIAFGTAAMSMT